ncbi:hypothetical protein [Nocardia sp. IFM 10818]
MQTGTDREDDETGYSECAVPDAGLIMRRSNTYTRAAERLLPDWFEIEKAGYDGPDTFARIEIRDGAPQLTDLRLRSGRRQRDVKPKDLRAIDIQYFYDVYAALVIRADLQVEGDPVAEHRGAVKVVERQRRAPGHREITPEVLAQVAQIYRDNIERAPTAAVGRAFGLKPRMASTYVQKAREHGYLPPTKQGKKQA